MVVKLTIFFYFFASCQGFGFFQTASSKEVCCESIGTCFKGFWTTTNPGPTCPVGEAEPKYYLYSQSALADFFTLENIPLGKLKKCKKIYFIVHGWTNSIWSFWIQKMKNELLKKEDAYVILVDWNYLATQVNYAQSASDTESVGAHVATVLEKIKASRKKRLYTWCIGFSLGAHLCGQVGRRSHLNRITALDPAGPLFKKRNLALNKSDTDFLDVIHTDYMAGYQHPIGHADFYPNKGHTQPVCLLFNSKCSHLMACDYFTASINNKCFETKLCEKHDDWENCEDSDQLMGYYASSAHEGIFYLETTKKYPYCPRSDGKSRLKKNIIDYVKKFFKAFNKIEKS